MKQEIEIDINEDIKINWQSFQKNMFVFLNSRKHGNFKHEMEILKKDPMDFLSETEKEELNKIKGFNIISASVRNLWDHATDCWKGYID